MADAAAVMRNPDIFEGEKVHVVGQAYANRIAWTLAADGPEAGLHAEKPGENVFGDFP
jgi:hypothetical protein